MVDTLHIAPGVDLPLSIVTGRTAILGISGAGKTYTGLKLAELMLGAGQQVVFLDPGGIAWGLRAGSSGKSGVPIVIVGGSHGDIPLDPNAGKLIADLVVDQRVSLVIDLSDFDTEEEQHVFSTEFASRLYRRKARHRDPVHLIVDEADEFAPQRPISKQQNKMLAAWQTLARRGRQRGIGCTFITQRPAEFHKSCLTQCSLLIALRLLGSQDFDQIDAWIKRHHADEHRAELMADLSSLEDGQAWFWSPPLKLFKKARVNKRTTFDSSATPEVGVAARAPRGFAEVDLEALRAGMADTLVAAEANDPDKLKSKVRQLERDVMDLRARAAAHVCQETTVEPPTELLSACDAAAEEMRMVADHLDQRALVLREAAGTLNTEATPAKVRRAARPQVATPAPPVVLRAPTRPTGRTGEASNGAGKPVGGGADRMLFALAETHPRVLTRRELGVRSVIRYKGGSFGTHLSDLKGQGCVSVDGQSVEITEAGLDKSPYEAATRRTGDALVEAWAVNFTGGAKRMLYALAAVYPRVMTRVELGEAAKVNPAGGSFGTYSSALVSAGVATKMGRDFVASEALFLT